MSEAKKTEAADNTDFGGFVRLFRRFYSCYWRAVIITMVLYTLAGLVRGLEPLVLSPLIGIFSGDAIAPAARFSELTLNNLSATMVQAFGLDVTDRRGVMLASVGCYVGLSVIWAVLSVLAYVVSIRTRTRVSRDMTVGLHRHLLDQSVQYFNDRRSGDFVSRLTHDILQTANGLDDIVRGVVQSLAELCMYGYALFRTAPALAFVILGLGSVHMLITRLLSRRAKSTTRMSYMQRSTLTHYLLESLQGIRVIKCFAGERFDARRIRKAADEHREGIIRHRTVMFFETPLRHMADSVLVCLALLLSFRAMTNGDLRTGGFVLFVGLSMRAIAPLAQCSKHLLAFSSMVGGASRINEMFLATSPIVDGPLDTAPLHDGIEFTNVSFAYDEGRPVLKDINLMVRHGETVALVGPSGGGKSTLVDLVLRLFDVNEGSITFDGVDIRQFRQREYRRQFGVVPQESLLFNTTLRDNIVYSREENAVALDHAIDAANAREFVDELPCGVDTETGERGVKLSGGQRQRIAIARAIYASPSVLILDEATSALDSDSELAVQKTIMEIVKDMTAIVIAHRLSTIIHADKVVVINDGRIEAMGRHEELLETSTTYRRLYELQFRRAEAAGDSGEEQV